MMEENGESHTSKILGYCNMLENTRIIKTDALLLPVNITFSRGKEGRVFILLHSPHYSYHLPQHEQASIPQSSSCKTM